MILRIIILLCAIFVAPSFGIMDFTKFSTTFEEMCFQNDDTDPFRVHGQETPLSSTIENFIALAEKFEIANPTFDLKQELVYFISEYVFENLKVFQGNLGAWTMDRATMTKINELWDPDTTGYMEKPEDPFTDAEKCSLYYMISHSMFLESLLTRLPDQQGPRIYNFNTSRFQRAENVDPNTYYPQEIGVVAIRGTDAAVSLSKVLIGLYVGVKNDRWSNFNDYENVKNINLPEDKLPHDSTVDALYAVTMADVLMRSKWIGSDRPGLAPNGKWISIPLSADKPIEGFCPMVYSHQTMKNPMPTYSYASVRGAADGLILGLTANSIYQRKRETKLSQILRMYYSPDGIGVGSRIDDINKDRVSFCDRQRLIGEVEAKLFDQMLFYGYIIAQVPNDVMTVYNNAKGLYNSENGAIFQNSNTEIQDYCNRPFSLEKPEDLPRETFLDVIVVMDSSNLETSFQEQQMIAGYLAKYIELRHTGSLMTILLDHKVNSASGTSSRIELKSVVSDTYSSSCAACTVGQLDYVPSSLEREDVIVAIDQLLQEKKENETRLNGANGKVVVYFNYQSENGGNGNNKIQGRLEKALRNLHLHHNDVSFYAVGLDSELLKKYAKNDPSMIFLGTEATADVVAKKIYDKISFSPALLQYTDCVEAKNERGATYENFVSPHTIQHYQMPAEYFYKSTSLTVTFESQNGYARVCHNRATMKPENEAKNCKNTTGTGAEFKLSNPCKSFTKDTCAPFYFSVMGMDSNNGDMKPDTKQRDYCSDIPDRWCRNLDQVKFKVSHTGVRCSGCLGLGAPPVLILLTVLMAYLIHKRF